MPAAARLAPARPTPQRAQLAHGRHAAPTRSRSSTGRSAKTRRSILPGTRQAHPRGLDAEVPGALHDQRRRRARDRSKIGLIFAKEPPKNEIRTGAHRQPAVLDSAGRGQPSDRGRGHLQRRRQGVDDASAHASARQGHDVHRDLSGRPAAKSSSACRSTTSAGRPTTGSPQPLSLPKGSQAPRHRPLRQLAGQPRQPRSDGDGAVGRSDVGRDDDRLLHVHRRQHERRHDRTEVTS